MVKPKTSTLGINFHSIPIHHLISSWAKNGKADALSRQFPAQKRLDSQDPLYLPQ